MTEVDYYELLEVERGADATTIKSAYRKLAMKYHPDKNGGCKENEAKFKAVSEAYDCLKDPQKRAAYDRFGHAAFQNGGGGAHDFAGFSDIFESVFGEFMGGGRGGRAQA
ncbi:MAG: DnaJ domain-containing protein, partial [Sphingomonas sp.]|uniref:DnaJ domain-containing protein n=1 Tax=Sphingomonas sp. TaxID=28214 RepID=UPI001ACA5970